MNNAQGSSPPTKRPKSRQHQYYGLPTVEALLGLFIITSWGAAATHQLSGRSLIVGGGVVLAVLLHLLAVAAGTARLTWIATFVVLGSAVAFLRSATTTPDGATPWLYLFASFTAYVYLETFRFGHARRRRAQIGAQLVPTTLATGALIAVISVALSAGYLYGQGLRFGGWYWFILAAIIVALVSLAVAILPANGAPEEVWRESWEPGTRLAPPELVFDPYRLGSAADQLHEQTTSDDRGSPTS